MFLITADRRRHSPRVHWSICAWWLCLILGNEAHAVSAESFDVVVVGATPAGISAAIAAARLKRTVLLIESQAHVGGMATSGLGKSDVEHREQIAGLFREFTSRVEAFYIAIYGPDHANVELCREGYYYEPSVAERVFESMLQEQPNIQVLKRRQLGRAKVLSNRLREIEITRDDDHTLQRIAGQVFVDATYEGDLLAAAGARFRLGRESRTEFNEPHAGRIYFDYENQTFLEGTTGEADHRLPAYTYRLCLTTDPDNGVSLDEPPSHYDRRNYVGYFDDLRDGRLSGPKQIKPGRGYNPHHFDTLLRALSITELPNHKTDVNMNPRPLAFPFAEENQGYVEGDRAVRERICQKIRDLTLGLLYFLQNDDEIPLEHRQMARQYFLPSDEFQDNGHFPFQLYVREARRLVGEYTLTELDVTGNGPGQEPIRQRDAIAVGEFPIDSFPCRKRQPQDTRVLEGYLGMLDDITRPYEIPYRILIPEQINGLIVPVAASTSHVAYSSIRVEPTWMALGQAAGTAAHLAISHGVELRDVPIAELQQLLRIQRQVIRFE